MAFTTITEEKVTILAMQDRLDGQNTQILEETVESLLNDGVSNIIFDFMDLDYINSSGLRILVMAFQRLRSSGGSVFVCCARDYIEEVFEISGYNKIFGMYGSRAEAISAI